MRAPVLLLHGALDSPAVWARVAPHLGEGVVLDRDDPTADPSPQAQAERLTARIPPGGAHLVGHSRGATAACWIAVERPELVRSLAVVASPPMASEVFRAYFRRRLEKGRPDDVATLRYLAAIPDDDFPQHALRRYRGRALVIEYEDDPLYSPTHTMFWRLFLPYAEFHRVPGGHRAIAEDEAAAAWLAERILAHVAAAEAPSSRS